MRIRFLARAASEYNQAVDYYERQKSGLGFYFAEEFDKTLARIAAYPHAWQLVAKDVRRCLIDHFPYGILYATEPEIVLVLSVMNLHRNPETFSRN